ncbi:MAG: hypothetical protein ACPL3P_06105 [Anaerolineales bacterium]
MNKFIYEFNYLNAILPELENYLLSPELYRIVSIATQRGEPAYPSLSLGTLLLSLKKAQGYAQSFAQETRLNSIESQIERIKTQWRQAWENKCSRELQNRANLWQLFLSELISQPNEQIDRYPYEVRQRVILELLQNEITLKPIEHKDNIKLLDQILTPNFHEGEFIWDKELEHTFPKQQYWFLYGKPTLIT